MLDIHALRKELKEAGPWLLGTISVRDFPAALDEIESLRAELAAAREKKPVAYCAIADDGYIGQYGDPSPVDVEFLERAKNISAYCDPSHGKYRVVPLIIPPGAGG